MTDQKLVILELINNYEAIVIKQIIYNCEAIVIKQIFRIHSLNFVNLFYMLDPNFN